MDDPDNTELLRTKLHRPPVAADVAVRPRLLERLDRGRGLALSLVCTPAGYGKSTLLSGWLERLETRTAWLSLDEEDSELRTFITYLCAALEGACPGAFPRLRALLGTLDLPPARVIGALLVNELDELDEDLVLVMDDYHVIRSRDVHDVVAAVLTHRPRPFHLAIAARRDPPLPLAALRAAGQMTDVRLDDLRLDDGETAAFLARTVAVAIDEQTAVKIRELTEGWAAGLRLASLSLRQGTALASLVADLHGTDRHIVDYLGSEVVARQPDDIQDGLLATAVLGRFCAPLCEDLLATHGAAHPGAGEAFVTWLERANLFVVPLDNQRRWWRYHHLFREMLRHLLSTRRTNDEIAALHRNAAAWLARHHLPDEALRHALAAGDSAMALGIVADHRHALMNLEDWPRLERWLRLFPPDIAENDPELLVLRGWLAMEKRFEMADLERVVGRAEATLDASGREGESPARRRAELAIMKGGLAYMKAPEEPSVAELLHTALEALPPDWEYARGIGFMHLAATRDLRGERRHAERLLGEALESASRSGGTDQAQILTTLCFLCWFDAAPARLIQAAERLLLFGERQGLPRTVQFARYFLGVGHTDRNELADAERHLRLVVDDPYLSALHNVAHSGFALARVQQARGREDAARTTVRTIADLALQQWNQSFVALAEAFDADLALVQGRREEAADWARRYDPYPLGALPRFYVPQLTWLKVLIAENTAESRSRAGTFLDAWQAHVERLHHTRYRIDTLLLRSEWARAGDDAALASAALSSAVALARPGRVLRPFVDAGSWLDETLARTRLGRDDVRFRRDVVSARAPAGSGARATPPSIPAPSVASPLVMPLSDREAEILALLADRLTNKEIAERLSITPETVKRHTANIYQKLDVHGRREAVERARSLGVLQSP